MAGEFPILYVLAGGKSSRFGSDKARALVEGVPLIVRIVNSLGSCVDRVTVVAAVADQYADLGLRTIADLVPGLGPLGGLQAALHDGEPDRWCLLVSCDFAAADAGLVRPLIQRIATGVPAIAYRHEHWEPLLGLYHGSLRAEVDRRIAAGDRAMHRLLDAVGAVAVEPPENWPAIAQVNTPEDLAAYLCRRAARHGNLEEFAERGVMRVKVLLFGPAANAVGQRCVEVELPATSPTVANLRQALGAAYPALGKFLPPSRLAVNHEFAAEDRVVAPMDEIALVGMVSGG